MRAFEISCITRPRHGRGHEHITHVGHLGHRWRLTREQVIRRIDARIEAYYLVDRQSGRRSSLGVVREPGKPPYLRAHINQSWNDDLIRLPRCAAVCNLVY